MKFFLALLCILPATVYTWNQNCITKPIGFGYKTTGGAGGRTVQPRSTYELTNYLKSNERLIIDLTTTFDYTNTEGWASSTGCFFNKCGSGFQESLAQAGTCDGRPATTVKYAKAGLTELVIGSDKSIISSNRRGHIKGKGLRIKNAKNVIIRDISITDINPGVIWAGDALVFDKVENVWIHRVTFARIGRQHLVTYQQSNKGITVSSCFFDGTTHNSAFCDGNHFWVWLFWGTHDEITLINNRVYNTAGRTPHAGGWSKSQNYVHLVGNSMENNNHGGIEPFVGSYILSEGNSWTKFTYPVNRYANGGHLAMVNDGKSQSACRSYFGTDCRADMYDGRSESRTWFDAAVLKAFSMLDKKAINLARSAVCV